MSEHERDNDVKENGQQGKFSLLENYIQEAIRKVDPALVVTPDAVKFLNTVFYTTLEEASLTTKELDRDQVEKSLIKVMNVVHAPKQEDDDDVVRSEDEENTSEDETTETPNEEDATVQTFNYFKIVDIAAKNLNTYAKDTKNWTFRSEKDGVLLFRQDVNKLESKLLSLKCIFEIDKPAKEILDMVKDISCFSVWCSMTKEAKTIGRLDNHTQIGYLLFQTRACLITARRDFCLVIHWYRRTDGAYVVVSNSVTHKHCPPKPDIIRGNVLHSGFLIVPKEESPKASVVIYLLKLDLKEIPEFALKFATGRFMEDMIQLRDFCTRKLGQ